MHLQEGCVTLKVSTVGSRDSIYRTAVEAAVAVALDPVESQVDIGGVAPTRCACRRVNMLCARVVWGEPGADFGGHTVCTPTRAQARHALRV